MKAPMLPDFPIITKCKSCKKIFNVEKIKIYEQYNKYQKIAKHINFLTNTEILEFLDLDE
jgi:hypothetical protein